MERSHFALTKQCKCKRSGIDHDHDPHSLVAVDDEQST